MTSQDRPPNARDRPRGDGEAELNDHAAPGGPLDLLRVGAVVLDNDGRIARWSPEAEQLPGYRASEALGRNAARLLVDRENRRSAVELFARVQAGKMWAGVFPVRHKDGNALRVEFRTMGLRDSRGDAYALGL